MVVENYRMADAALSVSMSPLLASSMEDEDPSVASSSSAGRRSGLGGMISVPERKHVHFEPFQPTHAVFTPKLTDTAQLRYRKPGDRVESSSSLAPPSSVSSIAQPNYDDFLRRVSVVLYQHLRRCEKRHREQQRQHQQHQQQHSHSSSSSSHSATTNGSSSRHQAGGDGPTMSSSALTASASSSSSSTAAVANLNRAALRDQTELAEAETETEPEAATEVSRSGESNTLDPMEALPQFEATAAPTSHSMADSVASPKLVDLPVDQIFREEHFVTPQFKYTFIRMPRVHPLTSYVMAKVMAKSHVPSVDEIFRFCKNLFNKAQLSPECTIVCLIYIERLMELANVPLLARTWKPIVLCGLLLASKVWQDLSSWNVEISNIYPQYPLHSINRLERLFLHHIQWDLYISASVYAKYYFALRSLTEKKDFRRRYNYTMRVDPPNSKRLEERSAAISHELYSKSL